MVTRLYCTRGYFFLVHKINAKIHERKVSLIDFTLNWYKIPPWQETAVKLTRGLIQYLQPFLTFSSTESKKGKNKNKDRWWSYWLWGHLEVETFSSLLWLWKDLRHFAGAIFTSHWVLNRSKPPVNLLLRILIQWYTIISSWKNLQTPYFFPQNVFKHYSFTLTKIEFHMIQKEP